METASLYEFYEAAVLPQFGIKNANIVWISSRRIDADEFAHYFRVDTSEFALIFEDYDGLGRNDSFIHECVLNQHSQYEFVEPVSATDSAPTYDGFLLPAPSQYCQNITGSFTLLKLLQGK